MPATYRVLRVLPRDPATAPLPLRQPPFRVRQQQNHAHQSSALGAQNTRRPDSVSAYPRSNPYRFRTPAVPPLLCSAQLLVNSGSWFVFLVIPITSEQIPRHNAIVKCDGAVLQNLVGLGALSREDDDISLTSL